MRLKLFSLIAIIVLYLFYYKLELNKTNSIIGSYVSVKHSFIDKVSIMYGKGYYNFMYVEENERELKIYKNGNYIYKYMTCNNGEIISNGKWKVKNDNLELINAKKIITFKIIKSKIYNISFVTRIADNKKVASLCLMKKIDA